MRKQIWIRFVSVGFCLSIALAFGYPPAASAQDGIETDQDCNAQILTGGYGYSFSGFSGPYKTTTSFFISSPPTSPEEAAEVGEGPAVPAALATFHAPA